MKPSHTSSQAKETDISMKLLSLHLTNYKCFRKCTFNLPDGPGLFFLCGDNQQEPRLEANGAGKTTLWEALYWLCFGVTPRGVKGGDLASWDCGKEIVSVKLVYEFTEEIYTVERTWNPIQWFMYVDNEHCQDPWDLVKDGNNLFLAHLGMGRSPFLHSILMAQGESMFLNLKPTDKAALFSEVMGLDKWLDYSTRASRLAADKDNDIRRMERDLSESWGRAESLMNTDYTKDIDHWKENSERKIKQIGELMEPLVNKGHDLREDITKAAQDVNKAKQAQYKAIERLEHEIAVSKRKVCETCGQPLAQSGARRKTLELDRDDARDDLYNISRVYDKLVAEVDSLDRQYAQYERETQSLRQDKNPFLMLQQKADQELKQVTSTIEALQNKLDALRASHSRLTYWVKGFKDLRLQLISTALQQLEIEVNSCLTQLGLDEWELRFDVDKETKSGSVQRGFAVKVLSPHNKGLVPWEVWSGGESQRLCLATTMGLSNLIRTNTCATLGLEVWDEPTNFLSSQGVSDLLESLSSRAMIEKRQIWVVDHRSLGFGSFDGIYTVVKETDNGSTIRQQR